MKTNRTYGKERNGGDILFDSKTRTVFANFRLGVFPQLTVNFKKNSEGGYDLSTTFAKNDGTKLVLNLGKTFPAKTAGGEIVEGITKGSLALFRAYDGEKKKEVSLNNDAIFFSTHRLKETQKIGDSGLEKVGYIKYTLGVEVDAGASEQQDDGVAASGGFTGPNGIEIDDDDIPF